VGLARDRHDFFDPRVRGFVTGWIEVAVGVMQAARAALPDVAERLAATRTAADAAPFLAELTEWVRGWWRLVVRRLAFADVTRASITVKRTPAGVIVRPAILGRLGQRVSIAEGSRVLRGVVQFDVTSIRFLSPTEFEDGPRSTLLVERLFRSDPGLAIGDIHFPTTVFPWIAALPARLALVAAGTALAMMAGRGGRRSLTANLARTRFRAAARLRDRVEREARAGSPQTRPTNLLAQLYYEQVAEVVGLVAQVFDPDPARDRLGAVAIFAPRERISLEDPRGIAAFSDRRTAFYQRWWRLVKNRLAFFDVRRATVSLRREPRGVIVRPAILGQLAAALDTDLGLLGDAVRRQ
jgi:hypothetical protein